MTVDLDPDSHYGVGPSQVGPEHEATIVISDVYDTEQVGGDGDQTLFVCLDCGFVTEDKRRLLLPERYPCHRNDNPIPATLREKIEDGSFPP